MTLQIGDIAPNFTMPTDNNGSVCLADYKGRDLILYFYPKDNTPGCTTEACDFNDSIKALEKVHCAVIGVSKDSVKKHENFKAKYNLQFPLASDEHGDVCERYGVWKEKSMYGKTFMGIERTTFLINDNGVVQNIWTKVKVKDHVNDILTYLQK